MPRRYEFFPLRLFRNPLLELLALCRRGGIGEVSVEQLPVEVYHGLRRSALSCPIARCMWAEAVPNPPRIVAPLVTLTKPEIAALARAHGLFGVEGCLDRYAALFSDVAAAPGRTMIPDLESERTA